MGAELCQGQVFPVALFRDWAPPGWLPGLSMVPLSRVSFQSCIWVSDFANDFICPLKLLVRIKFVGNKDQVLSYFCFKDSIRNEWNFAKLQSFGKFFSIYDKYIDIWDITMYLLVKSVCLRKKWIFQTLTFDVRFDEQSKYVFVGDYSGEISVLRISNTEFSLITTLKGHSGKNSNIGKGLLTRTVLHLSIINTIFE